MSHVDAHYTPIVNSSKVMYTYIRVYSRIDRYMLAIHPRATVL